MLPTETVVPQMKKSLSESIAADEAKLAKLQAQLASKKARLHKVNRQMDTRRKIMVGAWLIDRLEKQPNDPACKAFKAQLQDFRGFLGEKNEGLFPDFFEADAASAT